MLHDDFIKVLPTLVKDYRPAPEVVKHISDITLVMLIGPSGAGKTTLIQHSGLHFVPSDTTRAPRPGEKDGVDMNFRRDYDHVISEIKSGHFVQIAPFATGELYATKYTSYPSVGIAILPVMAEVIPIFRELGFKKTISTFITPPSYEEWMRRLSLQPLTDEQRAKRLAEAKKSFEFALSDNEVHFILHDTLEAADVQLKDLLKGKVDNEREAKAREIAKSLLTALT